MKLSLAFPEIWQGVSQFALDEWQRLIAALQDWSRREHNDDGTHGDVTADSVSSEDTRINAGLLDGSAARPSIYFVTHSEGSSGDPRTARAWNGFFNYSGGTYPPAWAYSSTDLEGATLGALFTLSPFGIGPVAAGQALGGANTVVNSQNWAEVWANASYAQRHLIEPSSFSTTGTVNDAALGQAARSILRWTGGSNLTITGLLPVAVGNYGGLITFVNTTGNTLRFEHENVGSAAANRVVTPTGAAVDLGTHDSATLWYDALTPRWRMLNREL